MFEEVVAERVVRGGSWCFSGRDVRSAFRIRPLVDHRINPVGFRLSLGL